jgi:hypothetical protein
LDAKSWYSVVVSVFSRRSVCEICIVPACCLLPAACCLLSLIAEPTVRLTQAANPVADGYHVCDISFAESGWVYVPIMLVSDGVASTDSMFVLDMSYAAKEDKITCIWYIRDAGSPDGWLKKAWWENKPWAAVSEIKQSLGISDDEDYRWGVSPNGQTTAPAQSYAMGVMESDPFAALTQDVSTHDAVVDALSQISYKAADVPLEAQSQGCGTTSKADLIAVSAATHFLADLAPDLKSRATAITLSSAAAAGGCAGITVVPTVKKPIGTPGPWGTPPPRCFQDSNTGLTTCWPTRTQTYTLGRTCTIITGGAVSFCTQYGTGTCTEVDYSLACTTPLGTCTPPLPVPPYANPNVPIEPDTLPWGWPNGGDGIPDNCTVTWTTSIPAGCTC